MYHDCTVTGLRAIPGESEVSDENSVLIYRGGKADAEAEIHPELRGARLTVHMRSRYARLGAHAARNSSMPTAGSEHHLHFTIFNWSTTYALLVHSGMKITLAASGKIKKFPLMHEIPLTAGDTCLCAKTQELPKMFGYLPFIDLSDMEAVKEHFTEMRYTAMEVNSHDSFVVPVREKIRIPTGHIAVVESTIPGFLQNSSNLVYQNSDGLLVLEMKSFRSDPVRISPGERIALLRVYQGTYPLPRYKGTLGNSTSLMAFLEE